MTHAKSPLLFSSLHIFVDLIFFITFEFKFLGSVMSTLVSFYAINVRFEHFADIMVGYFQNESQQSGNLSKNEEEKDKFEMTQAKSRLHFSSFHVFVDLIIFVDLIFSHHFGVQISSVDRNVLTNLESFIIDLFCILCFRSQ